MAIPFGVIVVDLDMRGVSMQHGAAWFTQILVTLTSGNNGSFVRCQMEPGE